MIAVVTKNDSKSASPLSLSTPSDKKDSKGGLSFGELLHGAKDKDSIVLKKGALVLALDTENKDAKDTKTNKSDTLASLLKNEPVELNPAAFKDLSPKELKSLIKDAKDYLKDQITKTDGYKNAQIKEMPQTLKGLVNLAKQYGVDMSKITLEKVQVHKSDKLMNTDSSKVIVSTQSDDKEETKVKKNNIDVDSDAVDVKTNTKKTNIKDTLAKTQTQNVDVDVQEQSTKTKNEIKSSTVVTTPKETPLFKAQNTQAVTTEQTLLAREFKVPEPKTAKERADDTLKLLLRGEKVLNKDGGVKLTTDFSVATARVIAPSATTEAQRSLESLLRGDSSESSSSSKVDAFNAPKADSFEVKINEAKQMAKYLSHDVKQAIDNYKAPFTRIKVQLNPQQLGEVDLTVIQRGKNLHVNISSNNAAINALAMNANDLRAQLTNNGIQNATLNFNSGSSDGSQANSQGQNQRQNQQASQEYSYFESEEQNEEVLSSLEIVVPNYA